jgi:predicted MPP superfamily phosphohydrolase
MKLRFAMILTVVFALFIYVGWKLTESFGAKFAISMMALLFAGLGFYRVIHRLKNRKLRLFLVNTVHLEMGFLSFVLTWFVVRDVVFLPIGFWNERLMNVAYTAAGTEVLLALSIATLLAGVWIASMGPWVVRVTVPIKDLPSDLEGFTIAQLSDMHIGPTTRPETVAGIVKKTLELNPRLIALTGDIGDGPVSESREALDCLRELNRLPCYYVTGNHEYYWNGPQWVEAFTSLGLQPLLNAYDVVVAGQSQVIVIGTPDPTARMLGGKAGPNVELACASPIGEVIAIPMTEKRNAIRILMAHQPGISNEAKAAGIDLQLSGHTHAGQFFPWTLMVKRVHEFSKGLGRTGSLWVYVNSGTGSWGPQVRLGTKTEITLLTLTKES